LCIATLSDANDKVEKLLYTSDVESSDDNIEPLSPPRKRHRPATLDDNYDAEASPSDDSSPYFKKPIPTTPTKRPHTAVSSRTLSTCATLTAPVSSTPSKQHAAFTGSTPGGCELSSPANAALAA